MKKRLSPVIEKSVARHLCFTTFLALILSAKAIAQETGNSEQSPSEFMTIESGIGFPISESKHLIAQVGLWNYWHLNSFQGRRRSHIGIGVPARFFFADANVTPSFDFESMISVAALFRVNIQQHPEKDRWWFFVAAGPEFRSVFGAEYTRNLPMLQSEFGFKFSKPQAILPKADIGFSVSQSVLKKDNDDKLNFISFFIRIGFL